MKPLLPLVPAIDHRNQLIPVPTHSLLGGSEPISPNISLTQNQLWIHLIDFLQAAYISITEIDISIFLKNFITLLKNTIHIFQVFFFFGSSLVSLAMPYNLQH